MPSVLFEIHLSVKRPIKIIKIISFKSNEPIDECDVIVAAIVTFSLSRLLFHSLQLSFHLQHVLVHKNMPNGDRQSRADEACTHTYAKLNRIDNPWRRRINIHIGRVVQNREEWIWYFDIYLYFLLSHSKCTVKIKKYHERFDFRRKNAIYSNRQLCHIWICIQLNDFGASVNLRWIRAKQQQVH